VDGLIWADSALRIQGFGVEITTSTDPAKLQIATNATGGKTRIGRVDHFGMRHRSMMRFCTTYPGSVGFVISQDGEIRAIYQVGDSLMMWENIRVLDLLNARSREKRKKHRVNPQPTNTAC